jgi:hypothetical protein
MTKFNKILNTPRAKMLYDLSGGAFQGSCVCNNDQLKKLKKFYKVKNSTTPLVNEGNERDMFRAAERDGFRVLTTLADLGLLENPGEDPVKIILELALDLGFDVDSQDILYCEEEVES